MKKSLTKCIVRGSILLSLILIAGCGQNQIKIEFKAQPNQKARLVTKIGAVEFNRLLSDGYLFTDMKSGRYHFTVVADGYFETKQCEVKFAPLLPNSVKTYVVEFHLPAADTTWPGGTVVFNSDKHGVDNLEIYSMRLDGSRLTNLTSHKGCDTEPSWSPDGSKIVFVSDRNSSLICSSIYLMDADGSNQTRLTFSKSKDYSPCWSPDGTRIGFCSQRTSKDQIFVIKANGDSVACLSDGTASDKFPCWSPDGNRIIFVSDRDGRRGDKIYSMRSDGSDVTRLTDTIEMDWNPVWSADGNWILFDSSRRGGRDIFLMKSDGKWPTRLTLTSKNYEWQAVCLSTGQGFLTAADLEGNYDIYLINFSGDRIVNLTKTKDWDERNPSWRPF